MKLGSSLVQAVMATVACFVIGCSLSDQYAKKTAPVGLITTPPSYYSSEKARSLGVKYKENLDRLAERIVRNPRTASLQFANNLSSVGGIGFFTHSAANTPDERYLEVIVSTPESFDDRETFEAKVARVFAVYGRELLSILAGDSSLYQENDLSGYGLNLTWRSIAQVPGSSRITVEGAVLYFKKEAVGTFLHRNMDQDKVLAGAVIFAAGEGGSLRLVSYRQTDQRADMRSPLYEESLDVARAEAKKEPRAASSQSRIGTEKEARQPVTAAGTERSTSKAAVVAAAPKHEPANGTRQKQVMTSKSARAEGPEEGRDVLRGSLATKSEISQQRDQQIGVPLVPSMTERVSAAEPMGMIEKAEKSGINKPVDGRPDSDNAEQQPNTTQGSVEERQRPGGANGPTTVSTEIPVGQKPLLRTESTAPETSNGIASQIAAAKVSRIEQQSGGKTAAASSDTVPRVQPVPVKEAPEEEKTPLESLTSGESGLTQNTSLSEEASRQIASALPAQENSVGMSKPALNAGAKNPTQGKVSGTDANITVRRKDDEAAAVFRSTVNTPSGEPKLPNEQVAVLKRGLTERGPEARAGAQLLHKMLEGYVIQVGFDNKSVAQHWGEKLERRGYAISLTEADGEGLVRLRLGNFILREEAERQLKLLKEEGLKGIVINLPQAYRPDLRPHAAEESAQPARIRD